ncbi:MAG: sugar ABC transporter substrate-binding protein [Rubrivivax sp.]|nr:sugar ABC transporter substrate-binding protein [Rubrivivax sp.]
MPIARFPSRRTHILTSILAPAVAVAAVVAVTACSRVEPEAKTAQTATCQRSTQKVIGWDFPLAGIAIAEPFNNRVKEFAEKRGYKVLTSGNSMDLQKQVNDLTNWVNQGLPVIAAYALEPSSIEPVAAKARANCVGFVSYSVDMKNQDASVQLDWKRNGEMLGTHALQWVAAHPGKKFSVLILNNRDLSAGILRDEGLNAVFPGGNADVTVISTQKAGDRATGEKITSTVLQAHPELNMVLAFNDDVALGARQAFLNAGKKDDDPLIYVGGQDGSPDALKALKKGTLLRAVIATSANEVAAGVANTAIDVAEGKKPPTPVLKAETLTAADGARIDEYIAQFSN